MKITFNTTLLNETGHSTVAKEIEELSKRVMCLCDKEGNLIPAVDATDLEDGVELNIEIQADNIEKVKDLVKSFLPKLKNGLEKLGVDLHNLKSVINK